MLSIALISSRSCAGGRNGRVDVHISIGKTSGVKWLVEANTTTVETDGVPTGKMVSKRDGDRRAGTDFGS